MKTLKKLAALIMCVVISAGCLSGCGGVNDEDVLSTAVKNINGAKSFDMVSKMSGKMALKMGELSQDMDMNTEINGTVFSDPLKAKVISNITTAGQTVKQESYIQKENDNYIVYVKADDATWSKMSLGDIEQALSTSGMNAAQNQLVDDISKYTKKDDREVDGKKYLVYDYTVSGEDVKEMMGGTGSSLGGLLGNSEESEQLQKIVDDMMKDLGDITMTILIDRDEKQVYQIEYSMTEMMNKMMDSLMKSISDLAAQEGGKDTSAAAAMTINVSEMNMVMTYSNIGSAADFEIPKEALDAQETTLD